MTETVVAPDVSLSRAEQWLARLGIRPEEKQVTTLLFGNMFLSGIAIGMIRVCAMTLFLAQFGSEQLALIAILLAVVGMPITVIIDRLTHRLSIGSYIFTVLGTIIGGLLVLRLALGISDNSILIFTLPLFFEVIYMLFSLQFLALLTRLLNVRQSKRLFGITRSGEFLAEMVGGLLVVLLLNFLSVTDLLVVAMLATGLVFAVVHRTVSLFRIDKDLGAESSEETDINDTRTFGMLRLHYVKLITLAYAAYIFAYFFLDVAFYSYATEEFPDERLLAEFIAQFFAVAGFLTWFTMVFLFAPILRRFGIMFGVLAFPVVILSGSAAVSLMEFSGVEVALIFMVMVITNGMRSILQAAIWKPTVAILFQVLPDRQRNQGTRFIEGVVDPLAGGVAGVCLYVLSEILNWGPQLFLIVLSVLMIAWIALAVMIRREYLTNLMVSIQKRKLGELAISELDNASLEIIKAGIASPYPKEIFYCLNLLEEIEHPEITELIKKVIDNHNRDVRMDVLRRIAVMDIQPLRARVLERIEAETDPGVRGQAMITYSLLGPQDTVDILSPYLEAFHRDLREGALIGILTFEPSNNMANDYLLRAVRADSPSERAFAADVMGEIAKSHFSGYLVELLEDLDLDVVQRAIFAAGRIKDTRLVNLLLDKLHNNSLQPVASNALKQFDEPVLFDLDIALTSPESTRQVKLTVIDVITEIGGLKATEILLRHIDIEQPELRHQIYLGLALLHYQADPDDQYIFSNKIEEEVQLITWLMAAMEDLRNDDNYSLLHNALSNELAIRRDNLLLLTSFLFPSIVMLNTRANIDSKVSELRIFALEVLDNLLTGEIRQIVLPLLDDITNAERLEQLSDKFPQQHMSAKERFRDLVSEHFNEGFFWTRSCLLYLIGQLQVSEHQDLVMGSLNDREPIIRETGAWSISRLAPDNLRRILVSHSGDQHPSVHQTVRELLRQVSDDPPLGAQ